VALPRPLSRLLLQDSLEDLNGAFNLLLDIARTSERLHAVWKALPRGGGGDNNNRRVWALHVAMCGVATQVQHHLQSDVCESGLFDMLACVRDEACGDVRLALRRCVLRVVTDSALANAAGRDAMARVLAMCQAFAGDVLAGRSTREHTLTGFQDVVHGLLRVLERMGRPKLAERLDYNGFWRRRPSLKTM